MKKIFSILSIACAALLSISCSTDIESAEEMGYLTLDINTLVSTHTRAVNGVPSGYNPKTLHVELRKEDGTVVMQTDDFENSSDFKGTIVLAPGTYTIDAHSANWDGSDSGFGTPYYTGMTKAIVTARTLSKASLTLTQANVKVTVNFDNSFRTYFKSARAIVESAVNGVAPRTFIMGTTVGSAYFPVGDLTFMVHVTNMSDETHLQENVISDVKARDHIIITYKVAEAGNMGGVTVSVDDATKTYTYTVEVPRKSSTALQANKANAWGHFADLSGLVTAKTSEFDPASVTLQWKSQNDADWTTVANSALSISGDNYSYKLTGLTPKTTYSYRLSYTKGETSVNSNEVVFTTDEEPTLYNGGFEEWNKNGNIWYANASGTNYWDSSNPGSASMGEQYNVTTSTTSPVHSGSRAAKLQSTYVVIKFAAASLFTGQFDHLVGTKGAVLNWGVPFTGRPTSLKGYMQYAPGSINRGTAPSGAPAKGQPDQCQIYCVLTTSAIQIDNTDMDNFPNWDTDNRVVAYGTLPASECVNSNGQWKEFNIPLEYHSLTTKPTHLIIVCSSSRYGDYFYGSDTSCLYLDDFELVYGDTPTVK